MLGLVFVTLQERLAMLCVSSGRGQRRGKVLELPGLLFPPLPAFLCLLPLPR